MAAPTEILITMGADHEPLYHSLPREYYLAEEIFEREYERVLSRQWLLAGHECQALGAGDYFTVELAGESIVIARADDGELHAFYNVCRHRGSRICDVSAGHVRNFVCPYHAWAYAPDGRLLNAPTIQDGEYIDYTLYGLKAVRVAAAGGFVFVNLGAEEPSPLAASFDGMCEGLPSLAPDSIRLVHEVVHDVRANWKLVAENNLECYHCPFCHDVLCAAMDVDDFKADIATGARYAVQDRNFIGGSGPGIPVKPGAASLTRGGGFASRRLLGDFTESDARFSAGFHIAPVFGAALFYADHIVMQTNWPITAGHTKQKIQWFVSADAVEGADYERADVTGVLDTT